MCVCIGMGIADYIKMSPKFFPKILTFSQYCLGNGMTLNERPAISLHIVDKYLWRHAASRGHSELKYNHKHIIIESE